MEKIYKSYDLGEQTVTVYEFDTMDEVMAFIKLRDKFQHRCTCFTSSGKYYAGYYDIQKNTMYIMNFENGGFQGINGESLRQAIKGNLPILNRITYISC